ncbi:hypothetical protein [Engelhardtia mirabilis]|uniref:Uncharacterized protein n=1 Tax=Engelhardtia mirabilis TaxID=2528011 RepID=A0A518BJA3_9BACT|nr:hypothetical protein Pla133_21350 [Planctomycetes bacterium Pla133]QDV01384.1 hypothetical protein Pla86_21350 [Planctomycetes bacterium Pla86]
MNAKTVLAIAAAGALAGLSGCTATHEIQEDHWNLASVPGRISYQLTGYRGPEDGSLAHHVGKDLSSIGTTLGRHFLNYNAENPFQGSTTYKTHKAPKPPKVSEFEVESADAPRRVFD